MKDAVNEPMNSPKKTMEPMTPISAGSISNS